MTKNEIKYYEKLKQKKYRDLENKFLIEGIHLIEECLKSKIYGPGLEKIFISENISLPSSISELLKSKSETEIIYLSELIFNKLSETVNTQGIAGIVNFPEKKYTVDFSKSNLLSVFLDNINDPGNMGTIIRTCSWFGVDEIAISRNSADIYNSKVIRASQGAIFNINIREDLDLESELRIYSENGFEIFLADAKALNTLSILEVRTGSNFAVVFGNEANGISQMISGNENYTRIKVRGHSDCESLNVAVTAGIILNSLKNH